VHLCLCPKAKTYQSENNAIDLFSINHRGSFSKKVSSNLFKDTEFCSAIITLKKFEGIFTDRHAKIEQDSVIILPQG
jgi:hypothetical protein